MNKVLIVIMFILLGTSLIVVSNMGKDVRNSFVVEYQNNKNLSLPDFIGKEAIVPNVFRLYNANGITIDYNLNNGKYIINGTTTSAVRYTLFNVSTDTEYTISYLAISGTLNGGALNMFVTTPILTVIQQYNQNVNKRTTFITTTQNTFGIDIAPDRTFNNFTFKLQLEKGKTATSYIVPKLIPVYKDNLTQQEKNEIGIGAFGGISKILKTINDIIKPVGDFVNGLLNIF